VTVALPDDSDAVWSTGAYVKNPCCDCCPPCNGRPAFKVPRTLYISFTGPTEVFGSAGAIALNLAGDSDDPSDACNIPDRSKFLHWQSACISGPGGWGACYYTGSCGFLSGGACQALAVSKRAPGSQIFYGSARVDVYQYYEDPYLNPYCYVAVVFTNFWGSSCTNSPVPGCGAGQSLHGAPVCERACPCDTGNPDDANPYTNQTYPMQVSMPFSGNQSVGGALGNSCGPDLGYGYTPTCLCAPVNYSTSGIPILCGGQPAQGCSGPVTWGCTLTE
jgi:hypothetical protein